jgi:hypothetical protein
MGDGRKEKGDICSVLSPYALHLSPFAFRPPLCYTTVKPCYTSVSQTHLSFCNLYKQLFKKLIAEVDVAEVPLSHSGEASSLKHDSRISNIRMAFGGLPEKIDNQILKEDLS